MSLNIWKWKVICVYFVLFRKRLTKAEDGEDNDAFEIDQLKNLEDKSEKR